MTIVVSPIAAVFFDLGDTLGEATVGGHPPRLVRFDVFPFVADVLNQLQQRGLRRGVISNTGQDRSPAMLALLAPTGLLQQLDEDLLVFSADEGITKASRQIFDRAAARAGLAPKQCLFVGEDVAERATASAAGWSVCAHPQLVIEALAGEPLRFVRTSVAPHVPSMDWPLALDGRPFVPLHVAPDGRSVYGLTSQREALRLAAMQFNVEWLGAAGLPNRADLYLLRDDEGRRTGFLAPQGEVARVFGGPSDTDFVLSANVDGIIAAIPPDVENGVDAFHFEHAAHGHTLKLMADPLLWRPPSRLLTAAPPAAPEWPADVIAALRQIDPQQISRHVERYAGQRPLDGSDGGQRITSRHILSDGNAVAVEQLVADLTALGAGRLTVRRHVFSHAGRTLHNIEAELAGVSDELVLVTAHLDSTAAAGPGYDPRHDPAPGCDDDASGVAAVLSLAQCFAALPILPLRRSVRFVLFNAEEQGLVGSRAYARRCKARGEAITAVWQLDMIGYNRQPPSTWEVHVGHASAPEVERRSAALAELLEAAAPVLGALPQPQVYRSDGPVGDPASGRSDHASFQAHGFAACLVSEDFFVDVHGGPAPDGNPDYHGAADTTIDPRFAAELARVVGACAWLTAAY
jgi:bacterial leucyl aminopeptidase